MSSHYRDQTGRQRYLSLTPETAAAIERSTGIAVQHILSGEAFDTFADDSEKLLTAVWWSTPILNSGFRVRRFAFGQATIGHEIEAIAALVYAFAESVIDPAAGKQLQTIAASLRDRTTNRLDRFGSSLLADRVGRTVTRFCRCAG